MIKKTLCFNNPAYLSLRDNQLVIKLPEIEKAGNLTDEFKKSTEVTRPIEDIGVLVLNHAQITITSGVLEALLENNCAVITCDSLAKLVSCVLQTSNLVISNYSLAPSLNIPMHQVSNLNCFRKFNSAYIYLSRNYPLL